MPCNQRIRWIHGVSRALEPGVDDGGGGGGGGFSECSSVVVLHGSLARVPSLQTTWAHSVWRKKKPKPNQSKTIIMMLLGLVSKQGFYLFVHSFIHPSIFSMHLVENQVLDPESIPGTLWAKGLFGRREETREPEGNRYRHKENVGNSTKTITWAQDGIRDPGAFCNRISNLFLGAKWTVAWSHRCIGFLLALC